mmetsp:Transcript_6017/g.19286  ORF Transcript_6017/g.19286 Transcript_6017/m.19286 type:complete len:129 (-) Transcript_6017:1808-2194(-)
MGTNCVCGPANGKGYDGKGKGVGALPPPVTGLRPIGASLDVPTVLSGRATVLADAAISEATWPNGSLMAGTVAPAEAGCPEALVLNGVTPADVDWREDPVLTAATLTELARLPALQTPVVGSEGAHWL